MDFEYNTLNDDWIDNFEKTDKLYQDFYKDDLYYINLKIIYINKNNEIEKIKQESFLMSSPNNISREEILGILKNNTIDNERKYTLLSILKYLITLEPEDITFFLKTKDDINFLNSIKNIDAINFEKSINMFQDLNEVIFIFYEKTNECANSNNQTKKVYIRSLSHNKKTIRKQYKDIER
jgi:hypothetical protein